MGEQKKKKFDGLKNSNHNQNKSMVELHCDSNSHENMHLCTLTVFHVNTEIIKPDFGKYSFMVDSFTGNR